jgi:hypothetical protein
MVDWQGLGPWFVDVFLGALTGFANDLFGILLTSPVFRLLDLVLSSFTCPCG